jgi:YVTN family beta-propeller protein
MHNWRGPVLIGPPCSCLRRRALCTRVYGAVSPSYCSSFASLLALVALLLMSQLSRAQSLGCTPFTAVYPCVYVVNTGDNSVSVVNANNNQVVSTLGVGVAPQGLAITPNTLFTYVADSQPGNGTIFGDVSVIDNSGGFVDTTVSLAGNPLQIDVTPGGGSAYVVAFGPNLGFVNVVDTISNTVVNADSISGLINPTAVAISPDGKFAYVADACDSGGVTIACVDVIDTSSHQITSTIPVPNTVNPSTASIAVTADGSLICLSTANSAGNPNVAVAIIQTSNGTVLNVLPIADNAVISNHGFAISAAGILYVAVQPITQIEPAQVIPVNLSTQTLGSAILVGNGLETAPGIALGPGGFLYVTNAGDNTVSVIDTGTNKVTATIEVQSSPQYVAAMSLSPPQITTQPASQTINSGSRVTLNVVATNIAPLSFQWFQGQSGDTSSPIAGATDNAFTTPALVATTSYWVLVRNLAGSVDSNTATISVNQPPSCTLGIQGSTPDQLLMITATVHCVDPQSEALTTTVDWGDQQSTTTDGGVVVLTHTYSVKGIYLLTVTSMDISELQGQVPAYVSVPGPQNPASVIAGQSTTVTISFTGAPPNLQVNFVCSTVTDSNGTIRQAAELGIACNSNPLTVTLTGNPQNVDIVIHTTGTGTGSLLPDAGHRGVLYAMWLPLSSLFALCATMKISRRKKKDFRLLALVGLAITIVFVASCGGGFTVPPSTQGTPPGNYQVTVIDQPVPGQSSNGFVQSSLIVPLNVVPQP